MFDLEKLSAAITAADVQRDRAEAGEPAPTDEAAERAAQFVNTITARKIYVPATDEARLEAESLCRAVVVAGRRVDGYRQIRGATVAARLAGVVPCGAHRMGDIVGYAVRETLGVGGQLLSREDAYGGRGAGYDVAVYAGDRAYEAALARAADYRADRGRYAVVDTLYACGHRS